MSIVTRTDSKGRKRFHARVHRGAGKYETGPTRDTEREAKIDEGELLKKPKRAPERTVAAICDWFTETYPRRARPRTGKPPRDSTVQTAKYAVDAFRQAFGVKRPGDLTREDLKTWLAESPWAAPAVKTMMADALDSELVTSNPLQGMTVKRSHGRRHIEVPTLEEVYSLAECAVEEHGEYGVTFGSMILFFAFTCMRPGEVFALEHGDIDGQEIHVRRSLGRTGQTTAPKNDKARTIVFPSAARDALSGMPRQLSADLVFTTKRGRRFTEGVLGEYWRPVRSRFVGGLSETRRRALDPPENRLVPYTLRHFGATYLLSLGLTPWDVAIQMGHEDGGQLVMQRYGHPSREAARERIRRAVDPAPVSELWSVDGRAQDG